MFGHLCESRATGRCRCAVCGGCARRRAGRLSAGAVTGPLTVAADQPAAPPAQAGQSFFPTANDMDYGHQSEAGRTVTPRRNTAVHTAVPARPPTCHSPSVFCYHTVRPAEAAPPAPLRRSKTSRRRTSHGWSTSWTRRPSAGSSSAGGGRTTTSRWDTALKRWCNPVQSTDISSLWYRHVGILRLPSQVVLEPGGCTAFRGHSNSNMLTLPARRAGRRRHQRAECGVQPQDQAGFRQGPLLLHRNSCSASQSCHGRRSSSSPRPCRPCSCSSSCPCSALHFGRVLLTACSAQYTVEIRQNLERGTAL